MKKRNKVIMSWLFVLTIMLTIFLYSSRSGNLSTEDSINISKTLWSDFRIETFISLLRFDALIRKLAHFSIYFVLGLAISNAINQTVKRTPMAVLLLAIICVFIYASSDEIHQLFVIGRSCELRDVVIDSCGGSMGSLLFYFKMKKGNTKNDIQEKEL